MADAVREPIVRVSCVRHTYPDRTQVHLCGLDFVVEPGQRVVMLGPKRKQERQRKDMLSNLKRGDRVQTIGGILGTVIDVRDSEVVLKVDESTNTKMRFARSAIHRVLEDDAKPENK